MTENFSTDTQSTTPSEVLTSHEQEKTSLISSQAGVAESPQKHAEAEPDERSANLENMGFDKKNDITQGVADAPGAGELDAFWRTSADETNVQEERVDETKASRNVPYASDDSDRSDEADDEADPFDDDASDATDEEAAALRAALTPEEAALAQRAEAGEFLTADELKRLPPRYVTAFGAREIRAHTATRVAALYHTALTQGLSHNADRAGALLNAFGQTQNPYYLTQLRDCFDQAVWTEIMSDAQHFEAVEKNNLARLARRHKKSYHQQRLADFETRNKNWMDQNARRGVFEALTSGRGDPALLADALNRVEQEAVRRFQQQQAAAENAAWQERLSGARGGNSFPAAMKEKWLTKEEFNALTSEQYDQRYDKIVEQIMLEKEGRLPRELTR